MARKSRFDNLEKIMISAAMSESEREIHNEKSEKDTIQNINIKNIRNNPYQPRLEIKNENLIELANSIKRNGLLQPIVVNKIGKNSYEVVAGHRRLQAYKLLKMKTIKAIVGLELDIDNIEYKNKMAINALIENIQRENLDILETSISLQNLLNEGIFKTKQDLAVSIGKNSAYVSKVLSILKLDSSIIEDLEQNKTVKDLEVLYELQKVSDYNVQVKLYKEIIEGNFSRVELREYNKKIKNKNKINITIPNKIEYQALKVTKKDISFKYPIDLINKHDISKMEKDINDILKKYVNR